MVVYNISINVDNHIEMQWMEWQCNEHIPQIKATGLFIACKVFKLLDDEHEDGSTYIIQYSTDSMDKYDEYVLKFARNFERKAFEKWGNSFVAFKTVMKEIHKN